MIVCNTQSQICSQFTDKPFTVTLYECEPHKAQTCYILIPIGRFRECIRKYLTLTLRKLTIVASFVKIFIIFIFRLVYPLRSIGILKDRIS